MKLNWFSGELSFGVSDLYIRCSYVIQIFNQYLLNKKGWYMFTSGFEFKCLSWITSLKVWKMSWTFDGKIRIHAWLSNTSSMHVHYWTSVSLKRLYIGQFPSLHFEDRDEGFVSKGAKDVSHDNKIFSCTMELRNESASFLVSLVFI